MREYAKISPQFWTGTTGKQIRSLGRDAQVIAFYLLTCPSANMLGLYYLPLPTLCHETASPSKGALKALRSLSEGGFAHYDEHSETVFVPEMAKYQIGDRLLAKDNRHKAVVRELETLKKSPYFKDFVERYRAPFDLPADELLKGLQSPSEAPSKPGAGAGAGKRTGAGVSHIPASPPAPRATRRCPTEFVVTPELLAWAAKEAPGVNVERETAAMRDYEFARPRSDWPAAWRNWMRKASTTNGRAPPVAAGDQKLTRYEQLFGKDDVVIVDEAGTA